MKIPKWAYERQVAVAHPCTTIARVAAMLRIEAALYRQEGRKNAANAIRQVAKRLTTLAHEGLPPAVAFDWPKQHLPSGDGHS